MKSLKAASIVFVFLGFNILAQAYDHYCGRPLQAMKICLETDSSTSRYRINWFEPSTGETLLPLDSRVVSPLDGSITYSGKIDWRYPFESYTLVIKINEAKGPLVPAVFTYAKTFERSEVYTFDLSKLD